MESSISHAVKKNTRLYTTLNKVFNLNFLTHTNQLVYTLGLSQNIISQGRIYTSSESSLQEAGSTGMQHIVKNFKEYW